MKNLYLLLLVFQYSLFYCQLSIDVKIVDKEKYSSYIPTHYKNLEKETSGYILELSIKNVSDKKISIPLDTLSYAIPFINEKWIFSKDNFSPNSVQYNKLGVMGFVNQNEHFIEGQIADPPLYDLNVLSAKMDILRKREKIINKWARKNKIYPDNNKKYEPYFYPIRKELNWYLINTMTEIDPNETISYKIYFNPYFKMKYWYSPKEFYCKLKKREPYKVNFKIIRTKDLYQFLTESQKAKYKNLFVGIVSSNTLFFK